MAIQQEHLPTSFDTMKSGCLSLFDPFVVCLPNKDENDTAIVTELQDGLGLFGQSIHQTISISWQTPLPGNFGEFLLDGTPTLSTFL